MNVKGIALPLIKEVAEKAKLKKKQENTFEGQGVKEEKPREVVDISEMPDSIRIPGMDTPESATNIKLLAEKKRASIMSVDHNIEDSKHSGTAHNFGNDDNNEIEENK